MKKRILVAAILAMALSAVSVMAEETAFNQASKWIAGWKSPCVMTSTCAKAEPAKSVAGKPMRKMCTMDALGNKVPTETMKDSASSVK